MAKKISCIYFFLEPFYFCVHWNVSRCTELEQSFKETCMTKLKRYTKYERQKCFVWSTSKCWCYFEKVIQMLFWKRIVRFWLQSEMFFSKCCVLFGLCVILTQWAKFCSKSLSYRKKNGNLNRMHFGCGFCPPFCYITILSRGPFFIHLSALNQCSLTGKVNIVTPRSLLWWA